MDLGTRWSPGGCLGEPPAVQSSSSLLVPAARTAGTTPVRCAPSAPPGAGPRRTPPTATQARAVLALGAPVSMRSLAGHLVAGSPVCAALDLGQRSALLAVLRAVVDPAGRGAGVDPATATRG